MRRLGLALALLAVLGSLPLAAAAPAKQPIVVTASSRLTLDVPETAGVNTATPTRGLLVDNGDVPIGGAEIVLRVNGVETGRTTTTPDGRFAWTRTFTSIGSYQIGAEFPGSSAIQGSSQQKTLQVVNAGFEILDTVNSTRGGRVDLGGRIVVNGQAAANVPVTMYLDAQRNGPRSTNQTGHFLFPLVLPATTAPGVHFANYTATVFVQSGGRQVPFTISFQQLVHVRVNATLTAPTAFPTAFPAGGALTRVLELRDPDHRPIGGIPVEARLEGPGGPAKARTVSAPGGQATFDIQLPAAPGVYNLSFQVVESAHVRVAKNLTATMRVDVLRVSWLAGNPEVYRGRTNESFFAIQFGNERTLQWKPVVNLPVTSDASSRSWSVPLAATLDADVGLRKLKVVLPEIGVTQDLDWRVLSQPSLKVERQQVVADGPSEVVFRVVDEVGKPVPGVNLAARLAAKGANWSVGGEGLTDGTGTWSWTFVPRDVPPGELALNVTGRGLFFNTQAAAAVVPQAPSAAWGFLPWILGAVALAAAGGGAYWLMRKRKAAAPPPPPAEATSVAAVAAKGRSPSLRVSLVDTERNLPPVWGAGDPFAIRVAATGFLENSERPLTGRKVSVRIEGSTDFPRTIDLGPGGEGALDGLSGPEGELRLRVAYEADADFDRTELVFPIRLVDYRKEIAREFDALIERGTLLAPKLGKQSTPREVQWALEEKLSADAAKPLDELASVVEHANYSTRAVGRAEWVRLVRARQALDPHFPAGREAGAAGRA